MTTDVMVARGEHPGASGYKRILIPTDFSLPAEKALQLALALVAPNARFDLVHFLRVPEEARTGEYSELVIDTVATSAKESGRELLESFRRDAPNATFSLVHASPKRGITEALQSGNYDLVVMGSYGRSQALASRERIGTHSLDCTLPGRGGQGGFLKRPERTNLVRSLKAPDSICCCLGSPP